MDWTLGSKVIAFRKLASEFFSYFSLFAKYFLSRDNSWDLKTGEAAAGRYRLLWDMLSMVRGVMVVEIQPPTPPGK